MILADEQATTALGGAIARVLRAGDVICLSGPLGVGKTSLARAMLAARGHMGEVPSPTFAIVQPYDALDPPLWHVDLYRLEDVAEMAELGLDAIGDDGVLIVEWPERAGAAAWPDALRLSLAFDGPTARRLTAGVPAAWEGRWPPR